MIAAVADTNVLLRIVLDDVPHQVRPLLRYAARLYETGGQLLVSTSTVSELVFVLRGQTYRRDRAAIAATLGDLLNNDVFLFADRNSVANAVSLFRDHHSDWDDCMVAAYALEHAGGNVASFDRGMDRIPGIMRVALDDTGA